MARNNLRYYRGQYNPSSQSSYSPDIISMYRPEEEMILSEAARGRQQRFDVGKAAMAQEIARIGDLDTVDYEQIKNRLSDFEEKVNTTVQDKYSGDYGAAANEITKLIAKERAHPFYTYNKQKVKAAEQFQEDARRLGADFMPTKNPLEVSYTDWKQGEDLTYTPVNRSQIVSASQNVFQNLAKTMQNDPQLAETAGGQYFLAMMQTGFSDPAQVMEFLQTDVGQNMVNQITESMPELQQLDQEAVMGAISQGAMSAIGQTQSQFLQNRNFMTDYQKAQLLGKQQGGGQNLIRSRGYLNYNELGSELKDYQESFIHDYKQDALQKLLQTDRYKDLAKEYNITDLESLNDLNRQKRVAVTKKRGVGSLQAPSGSLDVNEDLINDENFAKLNQDLNSRIEEIFGEDPTDSDYGIPIWDINQFAASTSEDITKLDKFKKQVTNFTEDEINLKNQFVTPISKKDEKNLDNMTKKSRDMVHFGVHPLKPALVMTIGGSDSEGKALESQITYDDPQQMLYFLNYLNELDPTNPELLKISDWYEDQTGIKLEDYL